MIKLMQEDVSYMLGLKTFLIFKQGVGQIIGPLVTSKASPCQTLEVGVCRLAGDEACLVKQ